MDYVVFGTGYGATLLLLGWALRTFGPGLRCRDSDDEATMSADAILARISWRRFAAALGGVIATDGAVLILLTMVLVLINPGDETGMRAALICFALILLTVAVWTWLYVSRYGTHGILPERKDDSTVFQSGRGEKPQPAPIMSTVTQNVYEIEQAGDQHYAEATHDEAYDEIETQAYDAFQDEEQESRYAKYQLHHPDGLVAAEPRHGVTSPADRDRDRLVATIDREESPTESEEPIQVEEESVPDGAEDDAAQSESRDDPVVDNDLHGVDVVEGGGDTEHDVDEANPVGPSTTHDAIEVDPDNHSLSRDAVADEDVGDDGKSR